MIKNRLLPILMAMTFLLSGCGAKNNKDDAAEAATSLLFEAATLVTEVEETVKDATVHSMESSIVISDEAATIMSSTVVVVEEAAAETTTDEENNASSKSSSQVESAAVASTDAANTGISSGEIQKPEEPAPQPQEPTPQPQVTDYGRILFVGDSRTVDMFDGGAEEIRRAVYNDITVYCKNACQLDYMVEAVQEFGFDNFDTLVSWMGCNDYGNFAKYEPFYNLVLASGKNLVVCTVGPTDDNSLDEEDKPNYLNARELEYNAALRNWAGAHNIKVIDLYSFINSNDSVYIDPADGIHYQLQPTTVIWQQILNSLGR